MYFRASETGVSPRGWVRRQPACGWPGREGYSRSSTGGGSCTGFDHTLTTGVVSGLNRSIQSQAGSLIPGGLQVDAAVNPGNRCGAATAVGVPHRN